METVKQPAPAQVDELLQDIESLTANPWPKAFPPDGTSSLPESRMPRPPPFQQQPDVGRGEPTGFEGSWAHLDKENGGRFTLLPSRFQLEQRHLFATSGQPQPFLAPSNPLRNPFNVSVPNPHFSQPSSFARHFPMEKFDADLWDFSSPQSQSQSHFGGLPSNPAHRTEKPRLNPSTLRTFQKASVDPGNFH